MEIEAIVKEIKIILTVEEVLAIKKLVGRTSQSYRMGIGLTKRQSDFIETFWRELEDAIPNKGDGGEYDGEDESLNV